jgi:hypothetical protein
MKVENKIIGLISENGGELNEQNSSKRQTRFQ